MSAKLDDFGVSYLWGKVKEYVDGEIPTDVSDLNNDAGYQTAANVIALLTDLWGFTITRHPSNVSASVNDTAVFAVRALGTGLTYQWQYKASSTGSWKNSSSATVGYNTNTLEVSATSGRNGYQYRCIVTDAGGSTATSNAATLTVA